MNLKNNSLSLDVLSDEKKIVLQVLALGGDFMTTTKILKCIQILLPFESSIEEFSGKELKKYLSELSADGLSRSDRAGAAYMCEPAYMGELLKTASKSSWFNTVVRQVRELYPYRQYNSTFYPPINFEVVCREMRIAYFTGNFTEFKRFLDDGQRYFPGNYVEMKEVLESLFNRPFNGKEVLRKSAFFQLMICEYLVKRGTEGLEPVDEVLAFLAAHPQIKEKSEFGNELRIFLIECLVLKGESQKAMEVIALAPEVSPMSGHLAWISFLVGDLETAINGFENALKAKRAILGQAYYFEGITGPFYILALLKRSGDGDYKKIQTLINKATTSPYLYAYKYLVANLLFHENKTADALGLLDIKPRTILDQLIQGFSFIWMQEKLPAIIASKGLMDIEEKARKSGFRWYEMEACAILSRIYPERKNFEERFRQLEAETGMKSMIHLAQTTEPWERALLALSRIGTTSKSGRAAKAEGSTRVVWLVDFDLTPTIQPIEQTLNKTGQWSKGRNIALKRFKEGGVPGATRQDQQAASSIKQESYGYWGGGNEMYFDMNKALPSLVGHPLLFLEQSPNVSVELLEREPELFVEETNNGFTLKFSHEFSEPGLKVVKETPTRYYLLNVKPEHALAANALGKSALHVPEKGKDALLKAINHISKNITIHSPIGDEAEQIPQIDGSPLIHIHILPIGDGFKIEMFVRPFKEAGPYLKPGTGRELVIASILETKLKAARHLNEEKAQLAMVLDACPTLGATNSPHQEWLIEDAETCLQILSEINPLREQKKVVLEWPKGEKFRVTHQAGFGDLSLRIQRENDWFGMQGELRITDSMVMDMQKLLALSNNSKSSFIEIGDGQYLALTKALQKKLQEIDGFLQHNKQGLQFSPFAIASLEEALDDLPNVKTDAAWKNRVKQLQAGKKMIPTVPPDFLADLRNYQLEGFNWLSRLAYWGMGACLADDMGLGKTIQAMAVVLDRAKSGPSLVVAPSSVCINWIKEIEKFAPSLNAIVFGKGSRVEAVAEMGPFDVLISSYGLMQQESELLSQTRFTTIILDEAQAIKNYAAKRTKAALELQGDFKILTTGTPIENHLGELWSLFHFINPGLLGSLEQFNERFAGPIVKDADAEARSALQRIIAPFVLRRKKSEVLKELPSKTEITLSVQTSDAERAFYEALRMNAVNNIERINEGSNEGEKKIRILAEIMRLRRACCNPKLVDENINIPSSKLELFGETVEELLENGHKALVFSQFVGHLRLIEEYIKNKGISYQYLDGQTPMKQREAAMTAFQNGEGSLFLISLKAGGTGLNLTAADYVIHMDPWWNPAVEDQASDRAHRIGQKRPVTIYRLVTENTIEEKILNLHSQKRELADSLLVGSDASSKLSSEDLLQLIKMN